MTAFTDVTFIPGTTITSDWLNGVNDKLASMVSVKDFGAIGDGVVDDTAAIQAALDFANTQSRKPSVYIPSGKYRFTSLNVPSEVCLYSDGSLNSQVNLVQISVNTLTSAIYLNGRSVIRGFRITCENTNRVTPIAAAPTIAISGSYPTIQDIRVQDAYIAVGGSAAVRIDGLFGFVHHRLVYLNNSKDISYIDNLHSQNPDGVAWDVSWYSYSNKVLVEIEDADGIFGTNWFSFAGKSLFKRSGSGNLVCTLANIGAESITHGIEIASTSAGEHSINISGGYLQSNNRLDAEYMIGVFSDVPLNISNFLFDQFSGASGNETDCIRQTAGNLSLNNCHINGESYTNIFTISGGRTVVTSSKFIGNFLRLFNLSSTGVVDFDVSNYVFSTDNARYNLDNLLTVNNCTVTLDGNCSSTIDGVRGVTKTYSHTLDKADQIKQYYTIQSYSGSPTILFETIDSTGLAFFGTAKVAGDTVNNVPGTKEQRIKLEGYKEGQTAVPVYVDWNGGYSGKSISLSGATTKAILTEGSIILRNPSGGTNAKDWETYVNGTSWKLRSVNDAFTQAADAITVTRNAANYTLSGLTLHPNTTLAGQVGFNNTAPIAKPTVTGSKSANAALASLITALANYGLITDSTT